MATDSNHLTGGFDNENTGGFLTGLLAEEDYFDRRMLWRLGSWGAVAVGAVILAVFTNQSSIGLRRDQVAAAEFARQSQQIQIVAKESQNEARQLASAIETLNSDRDRLYARVTVLEQGLESMTGAIARQNLVPPPPQTAAAAPATTEAPPAPKSQVPAPAVSQVAAAPAKSAEKMAERTADKPAPIEPQPALKNAAPAPVMSQVAAAAPAKTADRLPLAETAMRDQAPVTAPTAPAAPPPPNSPVASNVQVASNSTAAPNGAQAASNLLAALNAQAATTNSAVTPNAAAPSNFPAAPTSPTAAAAMPAKPLTPSKSMPALPDPAADKLMKSETPASAITAAPMPEATAAAAEDAERDPPWAPARVQRTEFGVDVGGANSLGGLRALWRGLVRSTAALSTLRPIIVVKESTSGLGMQLRLVAGPLGDAAAAAKICAALLESQRSCETTVFDGQRLSMKAEEPPLLAKPASTPGLRRRGSGSSAKRTSYEEPVAKPEAVTPATPPTTTSPLSSLFARRQ
jgi:hypothetical protein